MLGSLKEKAAKLAASATDAVSDIDMGSVKGKITTTVKDTGNSISQKVSVVSERVKDRVSDPATAYDSAMEALLKSVEHEIRDIDYIILKEQAALLRDANPYRT